MTANMKKLGRLFINSVIIEQIRKYITATVIMSLSNFILFFFNLVKKSPIFMNY
jgi:hypothetical protein